MTDLTEGDDVFQLELTQDSIVNALGGDDEVTISGSTEPYTQEGDPIELYSITANGGEGDDRLIVKGFVASVLIDGGSGDDLISVVEYDSGLNGIAYGGDGNDRIFGVRGIGGDGNDYLDMGGDGGGGDDIIYGGFDYSTNRGGAGSDMIFDSWIADGGSGDDFIYGGELVRGGEGSDYLIGYEAHGGPGNDIMRSAFANGDEGRDVWFGLYPDLSADDDGDKIVLNDDHRLVTSFSGSPHEFILTAQGADIDEDGDGIADWDYYHPGLSADDFLALGFDGDPLESSDDVVTGTAASEFFYGGGGDDDLSGAGGNDFVFGGFGDDVLSGNSGDDLLVGHAGNDRLYGGSGADELDGGDGDDTLSGSIGDDFAYGGAGNDLIAGGDGNDRLLGEDGNDRANGGAGNDVLSGGEGDDVLHGGEGNDTISGDAGNDWIYGGAGKDNLSGGSGADLFIFAAADSKAGGGVRDVISDFETGIDKLDLSAMHITNYDSQVSFKAIGSGLIVYVDINSNGFDYSDFAVQITGVSGLQQSDFILV